MDANCRYYQHVHAKILHWTKKWICFKFAQRKNDANLCKLENKSEQRWYMPNLRTYLHACVKGTQNRHQTQMSEPLNVRCLVVRTPGCKTLGCKTPVCKNPWL